MEKEFYSHWDPSLELSLLSNILIFFHVVSIDHVLSHSVLFIHHSYYKSTSLLFIFYLVSPIISYYVLWLLYPYISGRTVLSRSSICIKNLHVVIRSPLTLLSSKVGKLKAFIAFPCNLAFLMSPNCCPLLSMFASFGAVTKLEKLILVFGLMEDVNIFLNISLSIFVKLVLNSVKRQLVSFNIPLMWDSGNRLGIVLPPKLFSHTISPRLSPARQ